MSKLPDFEGLAIVAKVAEERSFAAAARALGVSIATVSRAVGRLEERLGGRIFNRTSRRLALTDFGRTLADRATRVVWEAEEAENAARELAGQPRGTIRLAVPMSYGLRWVAPILPAFLRRYPDITLDLHLSDATVDLIGEGFDAALRLAVLTDSSLVARLLRPVVPHVVAAPSYLSRYGRPQHPSDLAAHRCFGYAYGRRGDTWRFTGPGGAEVAVTPTGPLRATNSDAIIPALLDGLGIAGLPDFFVSDHLAAGRLEAILTDWHLPAGGLYFVTPTARNRPAKIEVLAAFLIEQLASRPQSCPAQ